MFLRFVAKTSTALVYEGIPHVPIQKDQDKKNAQDEECKKEQVQMNRRVSAEEESGVEMMSRKDEHHRKDARQII